MKLTDQGAILFLKKARLPEVVKRIDEYPSCDVDGRSDWQMLADEASWVMREYHSGESVLYEMLSEARKALSNARHNPFPDIKDYKDTVNAYNRLSRFLLKLKAKGYTGKWE